jgi:cell division transport system permease protein
LKNWIIAHGTAFAIALRRLARRPFASLFEVFVLGLALALPAGLYVAVESVRSFANQHPTDPEVSVFLELGVTSQAIAALRERLNALNDIQQVVFTPRQEAAKALRQAPGLAEVLDALPENPLPDAFTLRLRTQDASRIDDLRSEIAKWPNIALVQADAGWARKVEAGVRIAQTVAVLLALMFGVAALAITFNTIRLQMLDRRGEIELSRLIGATDGYIRRPYLYFGGLQGILGGATALAIVVVATRALDRALADLAVAYGTPIGVPSVPVDYAAGFLGASALIGGTAAWVASSRHLWARDLRPK